MSNSIETKEKRFPDNFRERIISRLKEKEEIIEAIKVGKIDELIRQGKISGDWS